MNLQIFQTDNFTDNLFAGNPAAVCPLEEWLPTETLQKIAAENFLPETAFFIRAGEEFELRWFTPEIEMDLCGHATLASAHVLFNHLGYRQERIIFNSVSGRLSVSKSGDRLVLDFPSRMPAEAELPEIILRGIGAKPLATFKSRDYILLYENEEMIRNIKPRKDILEGIDLGTGGIIVTSKGEEADFVSRFFVPTGIIFEDPVTGSAHCSLIPFWSRRLGKKELRALQISERKGELFCTDMGDRVLIGGKCKTYLEGMINVG